MFKKIVLLLLLVSGIRTYSKELPTMEYTWTEIKLPNNEKILGCNLTRKNELFVESEKRNYYNSINYGQDFNILPPHYDAIRTSEQVYDSKNGLYSIVDGVYDEINDKIFISYSSPQRDSVKEMEIHKNYCSDKNLYTVQHAYLLNDSLLLIGTQYEVYTVNIHTKQFNSVKYFDNIIKDKIKKDSALFFGITFLSYNKSSKRVDMFDWNGAKLYHAFSDDGCQTWDTSPTWEDCQSIYSLAFECSANYNREDTWIISDYSTKNWLIINKEYECLPLIIPVKWGWESDVCNRYRRFNGQYFVALTDTGRALILSDNLFKDFYIVNTMPYTLDTIDNKYERYSVLVYAANDGNIILLTSYYSYETNRGVTRLYHGAKTTAVEAAYDQVNSFFISPNPAIDKITIKMNMPQNNIDMLTNSTAEIYDLLGNKVLSCKVALQTQEIDISILNSGVYYIKIGEKIEKIIKI